MTSSSEVDLKPICGCCDDKNKVELKKSVSEKECSMRFARKRLATTMARSETMTCKEDEAIDIKVDDYPPSQPKL